MKPNSAHRPIGTQVVSGAIRARCECGWVGQRREVPKLGVALRNINSDFSAHIHSPEVLEDLRRREP